MRVLHLLQRGRSSELIAGRFRLSNILTTYRLFGLNSIQLLDFDFSDRHPSSNGDLPQFISPGLLRRVPEAPPASSRGPCLVGFRRTFKDAIRHFRFESDSPALVGQKRPCLIQSITQQI